MASFPLRLPEDLSEQLRAAAALADRSLNAEIIERLERSFTPDPRTARALDALDLPQVIRPRRYHNTGQALEHLLLMTQTFDVERLILAASPDPINDAQLLLLIQTAQHVIISDHTGLNMARRPRMLEVAELFRSLDESGLLQSAEFCPALVPITHELPAIEAAQILMREGKPKKLDKLSAFLKLLGPHGQWKEEEFRAASGRAKPTRRST